MAPIHVAGRSLHMDVLVIEAIISNLKQNKHGSDDNGSMFVSFSFTVCDEHKLKNWAWFSMACS